MGVYFNHLTQLGDLSWNEISIYKVVKNYGFSIFLMALGIYSGLQFLKEKVIGWSFSVIFWLFIPLMFLATLYKGSIEIKNTIKNWQFVLGFVFPIIQLSQLSYIYLKERYAMTNQIKLTTVVVFTIMFLWLYFSRIV